MIERITGITINNNRKFEGNNKRNNISVPFTLNNKFASYTAENLKANYMPLKVSFGSNLPAVTNNEPLRTIKNVNKYKGEYYNNFSDDVAIILGSEKDMILTAKKGIDAEIFTHNFADRIVSGKYKGMGLDTKTYDSINYIDSPKDLYNQNLDITRLLSKLQTREPDKKHLVVINNFEQIFIHFIIFFLYFFY